MIETPRHVAIIMDGNGRWATKRGLNRSEGHKEGAKRLEELAIYAQKRGINILSVYAFSTDNFKRSQDEVDYLMDLLVYYLDKKLDKVIDNGTKILISGRKENLTKKVIKSINKVEQRTKNNTCGILNICLNYGGQEEIVDGAIKLHEDLLAGKINKEDITRDNFYSYLYHELPPIDLLIRTGREKRVSNFMLYSMYYAEMDFSDILFPDYKPEDLEESINFFLNKDRRFGNVK